MKTTAATSLLALFAASHAAAASSPVIAARQTDDFAALTGCAATASAIMSAPWPGNNLIVYVRSAMGSSDSGATATMPPCAITSPPQKYASAYSKYTTSLSSWSSAQYDDAQSFALSGPCKDTGPASHVLVLLDAFDFILDKACSTGAGAGAATATTTTTASSGAPTGAGSSPTPAGSASSSTQPAAGAHVTHAPLAALAAAGVVAAAAML
ncbi:hypothetical protein MN608_00424 [Microdochium nivale]|nr:hypothetical protein MN608_00424 [Microdochium nivale]